MRALRAAALLLLAHVYAQEACAATRTLTLEERRQYEVEGFVIVRQMFSSEEVSVLLRTVATDQLVRNHVMPMVDASGRKSQVTLWNRALNNTYGHFARGRRWVEAATGLIGEPVYHFHSKLMLKEPRTGGSWEWHQDFGCNATSGLNPAPAGWRLLLRPMRPGPAATQTGIKSAACSPN